MVTDHSVRSVAFSPDGKIIAAGHNHGVAFWDAATSRRIADEPLAVDGGRVTSVALSRDGKLIAAGFRRNRDGEDADGGVVLWDTKTHRRLTDEPLVANEGSITSVAFSVDSKIIAAGYFADGFYGGLVPGAAGRIMLWDTTTRERLIHEPIHINEGRVESIAFSPVDMSIAVGYSDEGGANGVVLWGTDEHMFNELLSSTNLGDVETLAFSPDGKTIAAGCVLGMLLWDTATREPLIDQPIEGDEGGVEQSNL